MAGLAVGLATLATLTIGGTLTTRQATEQVRASNRIASTWERVFIAVSEEDEALHRFLATGTHLDQVALSAAIGSAQKELDWLAAEGGISQSFQVNQLRLHYTRYANTLRAVVTAAQQNRQSGIDARVEPAALEFAALRRISVANVERQRSELDEYLAQVDKRNRTLQSTAVAVFAVDLATFALCAAILVGYQRRVENQAEESRRQARHDALTGLANRLQFRDSAEQTLSLAKRTGQPFGLIGLDLNGFKQVNDTLGHHSGDLLLKHVAERLAECVRDTDVVARLGGDEFAILLPNVTSVTDATDVAQRLQETIRQPLDLDGQPATVGASIGVAVFPDHGDDIEALLQRADSAMYHAKRGKLGVCVAEAEETSPAAIDLGEMPDPGRRRENV